jgi:intraflagellar transport protein 172
MNPEHTKEFERLLLIAHYSALRMGCHKMGLKALSAKLSVSLLRYTMDIPVDRAFYDAGMECKEQKWVNMAHVFLNRFLDISDLVSESQGGAAQSGGDIDNTDFVNTDIPSPFKVAIPTKQTFSESMCFCVAAVSVSHFFAHLCLCCVFAWCSAT